MIQVDRFSRTALYEQIIESVEKNVLLGILQEGQQIQSVRELSVQLSINPNTIQKAYQELDRRGIIRSMPGVGTFVAPGAKERLRSHNQARIGQLQELVGQMALAGMPLGEIIQIVERSYQNAKTKNGEERT